MSIKIPNGFIFTTPNIFKINDVINEFRKSVVDISYEIYCNTFSVRYSLAYDTNTFRNLPSANTRLHIQILEEMFQQTKTKTFPYKLNCKILVLPLAQENKFLGMLQTEFKRFEDIWYGYSIVKDYKYISNIECPKGINYRTWKRRYKVWTKALNNFDSTPSLNGMIFECNKEYLPTLHPEDIAKFLPTLEERARNLAQQILLKDYVKENVSLYDLLKILEQVKKEPVFQEKLKQKTEQLKSILDPEININYAE